MFILQGGLVKQMALLVTYTTPLCSSIPFLSNQRRPVPSNLTANHVSCDTVTILCTVQVAPQKKPLQCITINNKTAAIKCCQYAHPCCTVKLRSQEVQITHLHAVQLWMHVTEIPK